MTESKSPTANALRSAKGEIEVSVHRESAGSPPVQNRRLTNNNNNRFIDDLSFEFYRF